MQIQDGKTMAYMMQDLVQYIMMPKIRYAPDIGNYVSYDIAAYDCFERDIVSIVQDVTSDRDLALGIVERFNRIQLSPCNLGEEIRAMLD
jgi:hypothetical protein